MLFYRRIPTVFMVFFSSLECAIIGKSNKQAIGYKGSNRGNNHKTDKEAQRMKRLSELLLSSAVLVSLLVGCSKPELEHIPETEAETLENMEVLTIGTADNGGTMYPAGYALAEVISSQDPLIKVNISASTGSAYNAEQILNGQFDMGLVSGDVAYETYFSSEAEAQEYVLEPSKYDLVAIGAVYVSISNWMTPADSGLEYVHDLRNGSASIGLDGSTTELSAKIALEALGIDINDVVLSNKGFHAGSRAVKEGKLDAVHGLAGIPIPSMSALAEEVPSRLLRYTKEELERILEENPYYYITTIPAGTYPGQEEDVDTFGVKCLLCVRNDMDRELVYRITECIDKSLEELREQHEAMGAMLEPGFVNENLPIPLHSGARQYYREKR